MILWSNQGENAVEIAWNGNDIDVKKISSAEVVTIINRARDQNCGGVYYYGDYSRAGNIKITS